MEKTEKKTPRKLHKPCPAQAELTREMLVTYSNEAGGGGGGTTPPSGYFATTGTYY